MTPSARREAVSFLLSQGVSARRGCDYVELARSTWKYRTRRKDRSALAARLSALAHERPRFGYRRLHALLRREGQRANRKLVYRLTASRGSQSVVAVAASSA